MKKTIIALAAASSVALSHGVAVAEEGTTLPGSSVTAPADKADKAPAPEKKDKGQETDGDKGGDTTNPDDKPSAKGSSAADFFKWNEDTSDWTKFQDVAKLIAGAVALLGSISALFANIEKIVKQFTNFGK